jgi:cysteine-S-conjugate beta-lyase
MAFDFDSPVDRRGTWSIRWDRYGAEVIPLWVADSDFRTPVEVSDAIAERARHGVLGYTTAPAELVQAIVERLARLYRWRVEPSWIVFIPGVVAGLYLAARRLSAAHEHGLVPVPVYQHLKRALALTPREFTEVPLTLDRGRWVLDTDALARALRPASRLFYFCNPHNPGGTVFRREELERIAAATRDLIIVSDEIHCDLVLEPGAAHLPIASLDRDVSRRTITLMSPNKTFNFPAAGCAWAVIEDAGLRKSFSEELVAHMLPSPSVFGYVAALAALRHGDAWLAAQIEYLRGNRDLVESRVRLPMAHVEATYLAWIDCTPLGVADPTAHFLKKGVALSPGAQFGDPRFVRLNFATQRPRLEEALERMASAA